MSTGTRNHGINGAGMTQDSTDKSMSRDKRGKTPK
jgi:hypothetical protein